MRRLLLSVLIALGLLVPRRGVAADASAARGVVVMAAAARFAHLGVLLSGAPGASRLPVWSAPAPALIDCGFTPVVAGAYPRHL